MTKIERYKATLTSDSSGDASTTISNAPYGVVREILVVNDVTSTPSDNWDLTVKNILQSVDRKILYDETVSNSTAAGIRYAPSQEGSLPSDGSDQTLTELQVGNYGFITVTGANMGDTKYAYVYVLIEQ